MKYILLKSILINNGIVGVVQPPERNCKNLINKEIFHTQSELKSSRRLWQFWRKTLGKLIQGILVSWIWQGNDRRCESPRAKSFHCEPILKTFSLFYWDFFEIHSSFIKLSCAIAQGRLLRVLKGMKNMKEDSCTFCRPHCKILPAHWTWCSRAFVLYDRILWAAIVPLSKVLPTQ